MSPSSTENKVRPTGTYAQGDTIAGRFVITRLLGEGGMGKVYVAKQQPMGRKIALKVMRGDLTGEDAAVKRFFREALAVSKLHHPNTVTLFDYGETEDGGLFIAMEYLAGMTLKEVLCLQPQLPLERALRIVGQVGMSLAEAHRKEIVHRDLKPDNIFLATIDGQSDFVKVIDFGIAHLHGTGRESRITQAGFVCGTPEYMSPEQARGDVLDGRSDLYSLGVMLFEMLEGKLPYEGDTPLATVLKHQSEAVPFISDSHRAPVRDLVSRLMSKDPDDRPQSAEEMLLEVRELLPSGATLSGFSLDTIGSKSKETIQAKAPAEDGSLNTEELARTVFDTETVVPPPNRLPRVMALVIAALAVAALVVALLDGNEEPVDGGDGASAELAADQPQVDAQGEGDQVVTGARATVTVTIVSDPEHAQLYVDNRNIGLTPFPLDLELRRSVELIVQKDGFEPSSQQLEAVEELDGQTVSITLVPLSAHLIITSNPADALVVDTTSGEVLGRTPLERDVRRSEEPLNLEISLERHRSVQRQILPNDAGVPLHIELERERRRERPDDEREPPEENQGSPFGGTVD